MKLELKLDKALFKRLKSLKNAKVTIGWFEDTKYLDDTPVHKIAEIQEYGATIKVTDKMRKWFAAQGYPLNSHTTEIHIPPRSFIRTTIDEKSKEWAEQFRNNFKSMIEDGDLTLEQVFKKLGIRISTNIKQKISQIKEPPLSQMTIAMKNGNDKPLIDSGVMMQTNTYKVEIE